jgi:catechol 2,3-dioxygenase-like lactoylglutathione lyase family enzyme
VDWALSGVTIRVSDIEAALGFYGLVVDQGGRPVVRKTAYGEVVRLSDGIADLELICPTPRLPTATPSAVALAPYGHFTLEVADLSVVKDRLQAIGVGFEVDTQEPDGEILYALDPNLNFLAVRTRRPAVTDAPASARGWRLHHVNVPAADLAAARQFYSSVLETQVVEFAGSPGVRLSQGGREIHLSVPGSHYTFTDWQVNPTLRGHFAITVADVEEVGRRLAERKVEVEDRKDAGLRGFRQLYCYDPALNLVEFNQPR